MLAEKEGHCLNGTYCHCQQASLAVIGALSKNLALLQKLCKFSAFLKILSSVTEAGPGAQNI
jgi:hypothetical protein